MSIWDYHKSRAHNIFTTCLIVECTTLHGDSFDIRMGARKVEKWSHLSQANPFIKAIYGGPMSLHNDRFGAHLVGIQSSQMITLGLMKRFSVSVSQDP